MILSSVPIFSFGSVGALCNGVSMVTHVICGHALTEPLGTCYLLEPGTSLQRNTICPIEISKGAEMTKNLV
jgi:hypothetical protein